MKFIYGFGLICALSFNGLLNADTCPPIPTDDNPETIPSPWKVFPSSIYPQYEPGIVFVRAQIPPQQTTAPNGVICTYSTSLGNYSIWQEKLAKPAINTPQ